MEKSKFLIRGVLFLAAAILFPRSERAATLTLDPAQSQITLSGKVASFTLREQKAGSLTTKVSGTMEVATPTGKIQITGATLDPVINGDWAPGRNGAAASPADLAGEAPTLFGTVTGALRDLVLTATSELKTLEANGQFDAASIVFAFPPNSTSIFEYDSFATGKGNKELAGAGTNQTATVGTFVDSAGVQTLTLALNATFYFSLIGANDTALTLKGQLVAKTAPPAGPTIVGSQIVNGEFQLTVSGASETSQLEGSSDLIVWSPAQATSASGPNGTRTFTVPASGKYAFFRVKG